MMKSVFFIMLFLTLCCQGASIVSTFDSSDGSSGFMFNDSSSVTKALIDSSGNIQLKGGLRLDSSGVKCSTAEMLIVDGSIGIGTSSPNICAAVEISSTQKGFLPPRMTSVQRDAVSDPVDGLVVYNSTMGAVNVYSGSSWGPACGRISVEVFSTAGTFTYNTPSGAYMVEVFVQGGGGGGGGVDGQNTAGYYAISGGGGAGGWAQKWIVNPLSSYTVVVGAGGAKGAAGNNAGSTGGTSSFSGGSVNVTATGGTGGTGSIQAAGGSEYNGTGGEGSGGDINAGAPASRQMNRWLSSSSTCAWDGASGMASFFGPGALNSGSAAGNNATFPGSGGSGVYYTAQSTANYAGGNGAPGIVIVKAYY